MHVSDVTPDRNKNIKNQGCLLDGKETNKERLEALEHVASHELD